MAALPDTDQTTKTQTGTAVPPPQKPPDQKTATATPPGEPPQKPPKGAPAAAPFQPSSLEEGLFGQRVAVTPASQALERRRLSQVKDNELIAAFRSDPYYVLDRIRWQERDSAQKRRLDRLIEKNPDLKPLLDRTLNAPPFQRQPQPEALPEAPPVKTAEELVEPAAEQTPQQKWQTIQEDLKNNQEKIEKYLNSFKTGYFEHFASPDAKLGAARFGQNTWAYLKLYRAGLLNFQLHQATNLFLFTLLGPAGDLMKQMEHKKIAFEMAWMKNPLNAMSIYYYMKTLPETSAFEFLALPTRGVMAVLSKGGAPLLSRITYAGYNGENVTKAVFPPILAASQASHSAADFLDKLSGRTDEDTRQLNYRLNQLFKNRQEAVKKNDKKTLGQIDGQLTGLLAKHDTPGFRNIFGKFFRNTAKRLRDTDKDPFSFAAQLLAGFLIDLTLGLAINTVGLGLTSLLDYIPGVKILRAKVLEFFTSNRWLNAYRVGGTTASQFARGVFSPTTVSAGYLGYQLGSALFPNAVFTSWFGLPVNAAGAGFAGLGTGVGAFYNTAARIARLGNYVHPKFGPTPVAWTKEYLDLIRGVKSEAMLLESKTLMESPYTRQFGQQLKQASLELRQTELQAIRRGYVPGLKPGPINRLANFLYNNWWLRVPFNGLAIGSLLSPLFQEFFGWSPFRTTATFAAADYLWQVKGNLFKLLVEKLTQRQWNILGKTFSSPHWRYLSLKNPSSVFSRFYQNVIYRTWLRIAYGAPEGVIRAGSERAWFRIAQDVTRFLKNSWARISPYFQNFFNPGFFAGFGLIQPLIAAGVPAPLAWIAGPLAGSASFLLFYKALQSTLKLPFAQANYIAWAGFFIGTISQFVLGLFGVALPSWYVFAWTIGLPLLSALIPSIGAFLGSLGAFVGQAVLSGINFVLAGLGAGAITMAVLSTALAVASVVAVTVIAGFIIFSSFWSAQQELATGPVSACFNLDTEAPTSLTASESARLCPQFVVTNDQIIQYSYIMFEAFVDPQLVEIDRNSVAASRQTPTDPSLIPLKLRPNPTFVQSKSAPTLENDEYYVAGWPEFNLAGFIWNTLDVALSAPEGPKPLTELPGVATQITQYYVGILVRIATAADPEQEKQAIIDELEAQLEATDDEAVKNQLKQDIEAIKDIDVDSSLLEPFKNFFTLTQEQINAALAEFFPYLFDQLLYFIPGGTIYEVCYTAHSLTDQPFSITNSVYLAQPIGSGVCRANETINFNQ